MKGRLVSVANKSIPIFFILKKRDLIMSWSLSDSVHPHTENLLGNNTL